MSQRYILKLVAVIFWVGLIACSSSTVFGAAHLMDKYLPLIRYPSVEVANSTATTNREARTIEGGDVLTVLRGDCIPDPQADEGTDMCDDPMLNWRSQVIEPEGAQPSSATAQLTSDLRVACRGTPTTPPNPNCHEHNLNTVQDTFLQVVLACKMKDPNDTSTYSDTTTYFPPPLGNWQLNFSDAPATNIVPVVGSYPQDPTGQIAYWRRCRTSGKYSDPGYNVQGATQGDKNIVLDADRPQLLKLDLVWPDNSTVSLLANQNQPYRWYKTAPMLRATVFDASAVKVAEMVISRTYRDGTGLKKEYLSGVCRFRGSDWLQPGFAGTRCHNFSSTTTTADSLITSRPPTWTSTPSRFLMVSNDALLLGPNSITPMTSGSYMSHQEEVFYIPYDFSDTTIRSNIVYAFDSITLHDTLSVAVNQPATEPAGGTNYNPIARCFNPTTGYRHTDCTLKFPHALTVTPNAGGAIGFGLDAVAPTGATMGISSTVGSVTVAGVQWVQGAKVPRVAPCLTGNFSVPIDVSINDFGSRPKNLAFSLKEIVTGRYYNPATGTFILTAVPPKITAGYVNDFFNPNVDTQRSGLTPLNTPFSPPPNGYTFTFSPLVCGIEEGIVYQVESANAVDMAGNAATIIGLSSFAVDNTPPTGTTTASCFMASGTNQNLTGTALEPAGLLSSGLNTSTSSLKILGDGDSGLSADLITTPLSSLSLPGNAWSFAWPMETKADVGGPTNVPFNGKTNVYHQYIARLDVKDKVGNTQTIDVPGNHWFDDNLAAGQYGIVKTFEGQTMPTGTEVEIRVFVKNRALGKTEFTLGTTSIDSAPGGLIQNLSQEDRLYATFDGVRDLSNLGQDADWSANPTAIASGYAVRAFRFSVSEPPAGTTPTITLSPLSISNINACVNSVTLSQSFNVRSPDLPLNIFGSLIGKTINLSRTYIGKIIEDNAGDEAFSGPAEWLRATIGQFLNPTSGTRSTAPASSWEEVTGN